MWRDHRSCSAGQGGGRERAHLSTWEPCSSGQGKGRAERGTRGPVALLPPRSPRLESFSLYPFSWKRALHCCDAVPCMLPLVRITAKPRVPGGLRRRFLRVPHGPSKPTSCPLHHPPTGVRACVCVCLPTRVCLWLETVCVLCVSHFTQAQVRVLEWSRVHTSVSAHLCACVNFLSVCFFLKNLFIYLTDRETARAGTQAGWWRGRSRLPEDEPDVGLDPRTPRDHPEPQADA